MEVKSCVKFTLEGHVALVELNRPEKSNAINADLLQQFEQTFKAIEATEARCVILVGNGKNFCGGLDLQVCEIKLFAG
jgi:enoyl-CoA hydratase